MRASATSLLPATHTTLHPPLPVPEVAMMWLSVAAFSGGRPGGYARQEAVKTNDISGDKRFDSQQAALVRSNQLMK